MMPESRWGLTRLLAFADDVGVVSFNFIGTFRGLLPGWQRAGSPAGLYTHGKKYCVVHAGSFAVQEFADFGARMAEAPRSGGTVAI